MLRSAKVLLLIWSVLTVSTAEVGFAAGQADFTGDRMPYDAFDELPATEIKADGAILTVGFAPGTFALESALDEAAGRLGIDPIELRIRNFADHDQDAGRPWSSNNLLDCYRVGAERFGWQRRPAQGTAVDG